MRHCFGHEIRLCFATHLQKYMCHSIIWKFQYYCSKAHTLSSERTTKPTSIQPTPTLNMEIRKNTNAHIKIENLWGKLAWIFHFCLSKNKTRYSQKCCRAPIFLTWLAIVMMFREASMWSFTPFDSWQMFLSQASMQKTSQWITYHTQD